MKVVFTYYPYEVRYNHGAALLSAICIDRGIKTQILPMEGSPLEFMLTLKSIDPDFICVSFVCKHDYLGSLPHVRALRAMGIPMLAGGVYMRKNALVEDGLFDYVCRGEAEILPDFFLSGDLTVFNETCYCDDISTLPLPDYSNVTGFEMDRGLPFLKDLKIIPYSSSRGCPYQCSFCEVRKQKPGVRLKKTVRHDLTRLHKRFNPDIFYIVDELTPYYLPEWREQIEGNRYPFFCYIRADIKPEVLRFLHANGMIGCAFGIESADEVYRNTILNKGVTDAQLTETVSILRELKIPFVPMFISNTPLETQQTKLKTKMMADTIGGYPIIWEYEVL